MLFKSLESLKEYLDKDRKTVSLNPVRFISVDSLDMWVEVKKLLLTISDESLPLSKFCEDKDTTPNIRRLISAVKKVSHSVFVSPLSEYLRINPESAVDTIQKIIKADYQNNEDGKLRVYFLMYRIKSVLRVIPTDDPRAKDCISYLETNDESDYKLTIVQRDLNVSLPGNEISGFRSYLEYWESNPDKPLILHTDNAIHFEKNHFFDDVRVIVSSYDLIKEQYKIPSELLEEYGSTTEWNDLAKAIITDGSFEQACCSILSINKYSRTLFERWSQNTPFQKWVLWIWTKLQANDQYHVKCAKQSVSVASFIINLYCLIIGDANSSDYQEEYSERKSILCMINSVPSDEFWEKISEMDCITALKSLTDLTDIERKAIFELLAQVRYEDRNEIMPILKTVYPKLFYYFVNDEQINSANMKSRHFEYFQEYKWLKATDTLTVSFLEKVKAFAKEKGTSVYELPTRSQLVSEHYDDNTAILFVDGMGIEYVEYLSHLFGELDVKQYSYTCEVGYCTLPSVTEINKDFLLGRNTIEPPIRDLDELKHANNVHPESLIKQFNILDSIKDRVLGELTGNTSRVIIAADHGTSRLAVKIRSTELDNTYPKPDATTVYKHGRFCGSNVDEAMYPTAINTGDNLVFADYSRFIQMGAPIDEIHGGASLEEWLVPVIVIEKLGKKAKPKFTIVPDASKIKPELGTKQIKVKFSISGPELKDVFVNIQGKRIECFYSDEKYAFAYKPEANEEKFTVKVWHGEIIGQFEIEVEKAISKNKKFDI